MVMSLVLNMVVGAMVCALMIVLLMKFVMRPIHVYTIIMAIPFLTGQVYFRKRPSAKDEFRYDEAKLPLYIRLVDKVLTALYYASPSLVPSFTWKVEELQREVLNDYQTKFNTRVHFPPGSAFFQYQPHLRVLIESMLEKKASYLSVLHFFMYLSNVLTRRIYFFHHYMLHEPDIKKEQVKEPIFVTGFPRSGTTYFHRVLAHLNDCRALTLGEAYLNTVKLSDLEMSFEFMRWTVPGLFAGHPLNVNDYDECHLFYTIDFHNFVFHVQYNLPTYYQYILKNGMVPTYKLYKQILQYFQYMDRVKAMKETGEYRPHRFILKNPEHLLYLRDLLTVFPDSRLVFCEREPTDCWPSFVSQMCFAQLGFYIQQPTNRFLIDYLQDSLREKTRFLQLVDNKKKGNTDEDNKDDYTLNVNPDNMILVPYKELTRSTMKAVEDVCAKWKLSYDRDKIETAIKQRPQHQYGTHVYPKEIFGFTDKDFRLQD